MIDRSNDIASALLWTTRLVASRAEAWIETPDGRYRYQLRRTIDPFDGPAAVFVMLNPSTAAAARDDPTIRRLRGFAARWACSELIVVNLFALRSTNPAAIFAAPDPVGPDNDAFIAAAVDRVAGGRGTLVCAWGAAGRDKWGRAMVDDRAAAVENHIRSRGVTPLVLRLTKGGRPEHPLYIPAETTPVPWIREERS